MRPKPYSIFHSERPVSSRSEVELIKQIQAWIGDLSPAAPEGIGDDCAVAPVHADTRQILTSDALTYGQHFDEGVSARDAGAKLVNRNLSDIAAMGGVPDRAILTLLFGPDLAIDWLEEFFAGIHTASASAGLKLVGGDVSGLEAGRFSSVLTVIGTASAPILRKTAAPGDHLFVTGELGGTLAGKHYRFTPRLREGQWLARARHCTSLMDVTDGLAKDLPGLLPDDASARIDLPRIPVAEEASRAAEASGKSALEHAFCDGEDYELLFTVAADIDPSAFNRSWSEAFPDLRLSRIGEVSRLDSKGKLIDSESGEALPWTRGFEHFSRPS